MTLLKLQQMAQQHQTITYQVEEFLEQPVQFIFLLELCLHIYVYMSETRAQIWNQNTLPLYAPCN